MNGNAEMAAGLRDLADWLDAHPDEEVSGNVRLLAYRFDADEFRATVRALGRGAKESNDEWASVIRSFGPAVAIYAYTAREQVCRKVVVGTRVEPERVIPAREVEIVEWECQPILAETA